MPFCEVANPEDASAYAGAIGISSIHTAITEVNAIAMSDLKISPRQYVLIFILTGI